MRHYIFEDASREVVESHLPFQARLFDRNYTRWQLVREYARHMVKAVVAWESTEPHVEFINASRREMLEMLELFVESYDCTIRCLEVSKNLLEHACRRTRLSFCETGKDRFGRGIEYIYIAGGA